MTMTERIIKKELDEMARIESAKRFKEMAEQYGLWSTLWYLEDCELVDVDSLEFNVKEVLLIDGVEF